MKLFVLSVLCLCWGVAMVATKGGGYYWGALAVNAAAVALRWRALRRGKADH